MGPNIIFILQASDFSSHTHKHAIKLFHYSDTVLCRVSKWWVYLHLICLCVRVLLKPVHQVRRSWTESVEFQNPSPPETSTKMICTHEAPALYHCKEVFTSLRCPPGVKVTWWMTGQSDQLSNAARHSRPWDSTGGRNVSQRCQRGIQIKTTQIQSVRLKR